MWRPWCCRAAATSPAPATRSPTRSSAIPGDNVLDGQGGADVLTGSAGNDTYMCHVGEANGDTVLDFAGNEAAVGDSLQFVGYGAGATFTNIDATHWQVNFSGGVLHETVTFLNGASIDPTDVLFS